MILHLVKHILILHLVKQVLTLHLVKQILILHLVILFLHLHNVVKQILILGLVQQVLIIDHVKHDFVLISHLGRFVCVYNYACYLNFWCKCYFGQCKTNVEQHWLDQVPYSTRIGQPKHNGIKSLNLMSLKSIHFYTLLWISIKSQKYNLWTNALWNLFI